MKSATEIIDLLEHVRTRKQMYFQVVDANSVECFVGGFIVACVAAELPFTWQEWHAAADERGWKSNPSAATQMRDQQYSEEAIVEELFMILIAGVRRAVSP